MSGIASPPGSPRALTDFRRDPLEVAQKDSKYLKIGLGLLALVGTGLAVGFWYARSFFF